MSQIHRNEHRFVSLSGNFGAASSASRIGSTLISVSLTFREVFLECAEVFLALRFLSVFTAH